MHQLAILFCTFVICEKIILGVHAIEGLFPFSEKINFVGQFH